MSTTVYSNTSGTYYAYWNSSTARSVWQDYLTMPEAGFITSIGARFGGYSLSPSARLVIWDYDTGGAVAMTGPFNPGIYYDGNCPWYVSGQGGVPGITQFFAAAGKKLHVGIYTDHLIVSACAPGSGGNTYCNEQNPVTGGTTSGGWIFNSNIGGMHVQFTYNAGGIAHVRRSGGWNSAQGYVRRSGLWVPLTPKVRRSSTWNVTT